MRRTSMAFSNRVATTVLTLFLLGGVAILVVAIRDWIRASEAAGWPVVAGTLTRCEIREFSGHRSMNYAVEVRYQFEVGGAPVTGERIAFGYGSSNNETSAQDLRRALQQSPRVAVHYAPWDASLCTLQTGRNHWIRNMLLFAVIWIFFSSVMLLAARRAAGLIGYERMTPFEVARQGRTR